MAFRDIITTLHDGQDIMGPTILAYHVNKSDIVNGSLLTVESNHFAVLKSQGAVLNVYETGQHTIQTPNKPILGSIQTAWFNGNNPWQFEIIYVNRAKLIFEIKGLALSKEMAEMEYHVSAYIHVDTKDDAVKLVQHMPFNGHYIKTNDVAQYSAPVIEQSINNILQLTPMEEVNEKMPKILELVKRHLEEHFDVYGIHLNDVKALVKPNDERMREIISFQALGLKPEEAVRAYLSMQMVEKGLISAPNMWAGQPFNIGAPQIAPIAGIDVNKLK